jgi:hypothetical protein
MPAEICKSRKGREDWLFKMGETGHLSIQREETLRGKD